MLELAQAVIATSGREGGVYYLPKLLDDPARRRPDIGRIHERYGWQPTVPLSEGLRRTLEYFCAERPVPEAAS